MKNIDFKAIAITVAAVVGGVALWEMVVKPMTVKKAPAMASVSDVVVEG